MMQKLEEILSNSDSKLPQNSHRIKFQDTQRRQFHWNRKILSQKEIRLETLLSEQFKAKIQNPAHQFRACAC